MTCAGRAEQVLAVAPQLTTPPTIMRCDWCAGAGRVRCAHMHAVLRCGYPYVRVPRHEPLHLSLLGLLAYYQHVSPHPPLFILMLLHI